MVLGYFLLVVAAGISSIAYKLFFHFRGVGWGIEPDLIATSIVHSGVFGNPYQPLATGPTAHSPPIYPYLIALAKWYSPVAYAVVLTFFNALLYGVHAVLLIRVSRSLLGSAVPGILLAVTSVALPFMLNEPCSEAILISDLILVLVLLRSSKWFGVLAGVALLVSPSCMPILLVILLFAKPRHLLLTVLGAAAMVTPWLIRDYVVLGGAVFIRDNFGLEMHAANNDCAQASFYQNRDGGCLDLNHPDHNLAEATLVRDMGELRYNASRAKLAREWIFSHPARFVSLTAERIFVFWFPSPGERPLQAWSLRVVSLLGFIGLGLAVPGEPPRRALV